MTADASLIVRGYLVFRETVTVAGVQRDHDPIGAVFVTTRRDGSSFIDTARAEARRLYRLGASERAYVKLASPICWAIQKRRIRLAKVRPVNGGEPPVLEPYGASYRAVLAGRHVAILKRAGLWHIHMSPGGTGLL